MGMFDVQEKLRRAGLIFWNDTLTGVLPDWKKTLSTQISSIFRIKSYDLLPTPIRRQEEICQLEIHSKSAKKQNRTPA
jgi:hypothetical protein